MIIHPFFTEKIAHSSYLIEGATCCIVIDPARDVRPYLAYAKQAGLPITHIFETHLHADFVSGHIDLAAQTGATIYAPALADCRYDHVALQEWDEIVVETMVFSVLETPGHTPEGICYVGRLPERGNDPTVVFTGDTLFVGDVGRPDLFPGRSQELAGLLYESLHEKLMKLPDFCEVYPAHGAGSLCGRAMGAKRSSTIGYERNYNPALQIQNKEAFIRSLTEDMPGAPDHFSRCSEINRRGPVPVANLPVLTPLKPSAFTKKAGEDGVIVVDVRAYDAWGGQLVPASLSLDHRMNIATFGGWIIPFDAEVLLVADDESGARMAKERLYQVGVDLVTGYLAGGMLAYPMGGYDTDSVPQINPDVLNRMVQSGESVLVDVRDVPEFAEGSIEGAYNIPAPDLRTRHTELDPSKAIVLICGTGMRSAMGCSLLKRRGFANVYNGAGGLTGYLKAGYH